MPTHFSLSWPKNNQKKLFLIKNLKHEPKKYTENTKKKKPAADYIIFGRLCSTILPWYVLHINFKVFVCLGLL